MKSTLTFAGKHLIELLESNAAPERVLFFCGQIDHEGIAGIVEAVDSLMGRYGFGKSIRSRTKLIIVEVVENAMKHGCKSSVHVPYFTIYLETDAVVMECGNAMTRKDYEFLAQRTKELETLDIQQITERYMTQMREGEFYGESNGGLGIWSIAKRSNNGARYTYQQVSDNDFFCQLNVTLKEKSTAKLPLSS